MSAFGPKRTCPSHAGMSVLAEADNSACADSRRPVSVGSRIRGVGCAVVPPVAGLRRIESVGSAIALFVDPKRHGLSLLEFRRDKRRYIDGIFLSSRHSLELRILLDCQRSMIAIAVNNRGAI